MSLRYCYIMSYRVACYKAAVKKVKASQTSGLSLLSAMLVDNLLISLPPYLSSLNSTHSGKPWVKFSNFEVVLPMEFSLSILNSILKSW